MAVEAALPVERHPFLTRENAVGVVARDAAKLPRTSLEALAGVHLFDLTDRLVVVREVRRTHEDGQVVVQRQPGPVLVRLFAWPRDSAFALQVALLAHAFAQAGRQVLRVNDGTVDPVDHLTALDVQLAGAVAAFAADGVALEDRRLEAVVGVLHRLGPVGVAKEAGGGNGPLEVLMPSFVAGRQVPSLFLREPADGRLVQVAIGVDEEGVAARTRAQRELHLRLVLEDDSPVGVAAAFVVEYAVPPAYDLVMESPGIEGVVAGGIVADQRARFEDRGQRPTHGMTAVAVHDLGVTLVATRVADVLDAWLRVQKRAAEHGPLPGRLFCLQLPRIGRRPCRAPLPRRPTADCAHGQHARDQGTSEEARTS